MLCYKMPVARSQDLVVILHVENYVTDLLCAIQFLQNVLRQAPFSWHIAILETGSEPLHERAAVYEISDTISYSFSQNLWDPMLSSQKLVESLEMQARLFWVHDCNLISLSLQSQSFVTYFNMSIDSKVNLADTYICIYENDCEKFRSLYSSWNRKNIPNVFSKEHITLHTNWNGTSNRASSFLVKSWNAKLKWIPKNTESNFYLLSHETSNSVVQQEHSIVTKENSKEISNQSNVDFQSISFDANTVVPVDLIPWPKVQFLSLPHRKDRRNFLCKQKYPFSFEFQTAIDKRPLGAQGRLETYKQALSKLNEKLLWLCEDDVHFQFDTIFDSMDSTTFLQKLSEFVNEDYQICIIQGQFEGSSIKGTTFVNIQKLHKFTSIIVKSQFQLQLLQFLESKNSFTDMPKSFHVVSFTPSQAIERKTFSDISNSFAK